MGALPHDFVLFAGPLGTEYQTGVINSITGPQAIEDSSSVGTGLFDVKPLFSTNQYSARIDALEAFNNGSSPILCNGRWSIYVAKTALNDIEVWVGWNSNAGDKVAIYHPEGTTTSVAMSQYITGQSAPSTSTPSAGKLYLAYVLPDATGTWSTRLEKTNAGQEQQVNLFAQSEYTTLNPSTTTALNTSGVAYTGSYSISAPQNDTENINWTLDYELNFYNSATATALTVPDDTATLALSWDMEAANV